MKRTFAIIIILLSGLILIGYLFRDELQVFVSPDDIFIIADTADVRRIELISEDSIILVKEHNKWILNSGTPASSVSVNNFLFSFSRMKAKGSRNNAGLEDEKYVQLTIAEGRKIHHFRYYHINEVSYLQNERSNKLFVIEVDGFPNINPSEIISKDPDYWKDRTLLNLKSDDIKEILVLHTAEPQKDFQIRILDGRPILFDGNGTNLLPEVLTDTEKLNFYLSYFSNVFYDRTYTGEDLTDSQPKWVIKVTDKEERKYELQISPLNTSTGVDMFKALVKYNDQPDYKLTRFMVLDLLLQEKQHFLVE